MGFALRSPLGAMGLPRHVMTLERPVWGMGLLASAPLPFGDGSRWQRDLHSSDAG